MEAMDLVRTDQPLLSLRCTKDMPKEYWQAAIDLVRTGLGFPAVYNDELIIATKTKLGVAEEDMWNYALMGCVEPVIPGKEYSYQGECLLSWGKVLELVLFDGYNESSGVEIEMAEKHELVEFVTFTDFYEWFKRELLFFIDRGIQQSKLLNAVQYKRWPIAFLSSTMDGPYKSGKDVTAGGAKYSFGTLNAIGMADVVDSLQAIKELVFERKQLSLTEFSEILKNDYVGSEALLNEVLNLSNKYGNDVKEVDAMMKELTDLAAAAISAQTNQWGNPYQASYISVQHHGYMGKYTAALPNGRRRGAAMANSLAPCQGAERSGPTATVNSVTTVDHGKLANCMVFDLKFSPAFLASPAHQEGLINLIKTYFAKGGMEMQINVVDRETLVNAQKNPEQYKNLIVRVSGFSAHFIYLDKTVQDELIKRTEHA